MNCAVHPPAAKKRGVRRVNDGVDIELRDVAADDVDFAVRESFDHRYSPS